MNRDYSYCISNKNNKQCESCKRNIHYYNYKNVISEMLWYIEPMKKDCVNFIE
jgi:hypothetical protein